MLHRACLAIVLVACLAPDARPQSASQLGGRVTDPSGAVVPGAQIAAVHTETGVQTTAPSNSQGYYLFPHLLPGEYRVTVQHAGFRPVARAGILIDTGARRTLDFSLEVGDVTQTLNVEAAAPLLDSGDGTIGQLIEKAALQNMPLDTRRSASLVQLMGFVAFNQEGGSEQIPIFSMGGGRSFNQQWSLDGGAIQNVSLGAASVNLNPPAEALQEFKAEANNNSAEHGRSGGGLVLMTTRSGGNRFQFALYEFLRNDKFDARTFFSPGKAPLRYNIFGGSVGGPIARNRTFFFFNYEGTRRRTGQTISDYDVPHPENVRGDFSRRTDVNLMDPLANSPFPGKIIPASRMDPVGAAIAKMYPAPNSYSNDPARAPRDNYLKNTVDKLSQNFYTARVDHSFRETDRAYARYSYSFASPDTGGVFEERYADPRAFRTWNRNHNGMVSWIHNFTPTLFGETRWLVGWRTHQNLSAGMGSGKNGELGIKGVDQEAMATINLTGLTGIGAATHRRFENPVVTYQGIQNFTWIRGRMTVKSGFEYRSSRQGNKEDGSIGGTFSFIDRGIGDPVASLLLGWVNSGRVRETLLLTTRSDYYGSFVQADWNLSRTFVLNLGLRWELDAPYRETTDNRVNGFDRYARNPVAGVPGVITFAGRDGQSEYAHQFDKNNLGPRVGFAWRFGPSWVMRSSYGIRYYGPYQGGVLNRAASGFSTYYSAVSPDGISPAFVFRNGMPAIPANEPLTAAFGAVAPGQAPRTAPDFFDRDHVSGYMQQWNFGLQRQLARHLVIEAAYLGSVGHKLAGSNVDINMIPLVNGRGPARQDRNLRPFPQFNSITWNSPSWGNSSYHGLNLKLDKRYANGLNLLVNYTRSKFLDDVKSVNEPAGASGNGHTHIELHGLDKSYSGNDLRNRFISSLVYDLPFGQGRRWKLRHRALDLVAGGWGTGGILEFRSGRPFGVVEQTNVSNTYSHNQRPNLLYDPMLPSDRPRAEFLARYLDAAAFAAPGTGVFGNSPRTLCCGPGYANVDLSLNKRFTLSERTHLRFRADSFNLANRPTFALPELRRGNSAFGRTASIQGGSRGRQLQFSLRLEF